MLPPSRFSSTHRDRTKPAGSAARTPTVGRDRRASPSGLAQWPRPAAAADLRILLTERTRHSAPGHSCVSKSHLLFSAMACLTARRKSASFCEKRTNAFPNLKATGALFGFGAGHPVMLDSPFPLEASLPGYNRTGPPPCMRWRGPCQATLRQVSQLPGLPDFPGRPPVSAYPQLIPVSRFLPRPRSCLRAGIRFPNGESISTAAGGCRARAYDKILATFFLSTPCPQNRASCPQSTKVIHGLCTTLSTDHRW